MTNFSSIRLDNWRQFDDVSIKFHPRLTIITGSNGAGKSTILNLCAQHFGQVRQFIATPKRKKGGGLKYDLGYYMPYDPKGDKSDIDQDDDLDEYDENVHKQLAHTSPRSETLLTQRTPPAQGEFVKIGAIEYSNGISTELGYHENQVQAFGITIANQQQVSGVPISSHRVVSSYQPVQGLSLSLSSLPNAYQAFFNEYLTRSNGGHTGSSPLYRMKETLVMMAAFGEGNQHLEKNEELSAAFEGFGKILKSVLPREIGFQKLVIRIPDIVLKTRSGEFILDASSGGVTAVIEIAWQLYLYSLDNGSFTVTMDEPENHLHPSMQRSILSNLLDAFPQAQFIVATHSPFIVSAVEDSRVYALQYVGAVGQSGFPSRGPRRVRSIALDQTKKAGNATEILKDVLGVSISMPEWAANRLNSIVDEFEYSNIDPETLAQLRSRLSEVGFSEYYPEALARLVQDR